MSGTGRRGGFNPLIAGFIAGAAMALVLGLLVNINLNLAAPWTTTHTLTAQVTDVDGISVSSDVRIAGRAVGQITAVTSQGNFSTVTFHVDDGDWPLPGDTSASIRLATLLGQKYLQLTPGTDRSHPFGDNATIALKATKPVVDFDQILNTFNQPTRDSIKSLIKTAASAVQGQEGTLQQLLPDLRDLSVHSVAPTGELVTRNAEINNILINLGTTADQLNQSGNDLVGVIDNMNTITGALASNQSALEGYITNTNSLNQVTNSVLSNGHDAEFNAGLKRLGSFATQLDQLMTHAGAGDVPLRQRRSPSTHQLVYQDAVNLVFQIGAATAQSDKSGFFLRQYANGADPCGLIGPTCVATALPPTAAPAASTTLPKCLPGLPCLPLPPLPKITLPPVPTLPPILPTPRSGPTPPAPTPTLPICLPPLCAQQASDQVVDAAGIVGMAVRKQPRVRPFWSGLVAAIVLVVAMVAVVIGGIPGGPGISLPWNHTMVLHVQLANADGLSPHASVDVAGVKVGEVHDVTSQGDIAVATLNIDPQYGDIHNDAQVLLRPHGLFGPKYIEITPGTSSGQTLASGDTINVRNSVQPVDLDQVLQALQAPEAQNLRTAIVEFGKASAGQGDDVNHLLAAANTLTQTLQTPLLTLDNVSTNFNDFIIKNESFNASFAQAPLDQLVAASNTTLAAFAANSVQLGSLLDHADSTLTTLDACAERPGHATSSRPSSCSASRAAPSTSSTPSTVCSDCSRPTSPARRRLPGRRPATSPRASSTPSRTSSQRSRRTTAAITVTKLSACPEQDKEYYLRVQVVQPGRQRQALQNLCNLPIPPGILPKPPVPLPCTVPANAQSRPGSDVVAGEYANLGALIGS